SAVHPLAEPDHLHTAVHVQQLDVLTVRVQHSSDEQSEGVGSAIDGRDRSHWSLPFLSVFSLRSLHTHGPRSHHGGSWSSASRPSGLLPGTASSCATSACRHLTRLGIPPALCIPLGSGSSPSFSASAARSAR